MATTALEPVRRIVLATPATRGGLRNAGTDNPASRLSAARNLAIVANLVAATPSTRQPSHEGATIISGRPPYRLVRSVVEKRVPSLDAPELLDSAALRLGIAQRPRASFARVRECGVGQGQGRGGETRQWRSSHDREIVRLAVPAFGALIAEPLYLLADTAIVGHLGTRELGGIAIASIVLTAVFGIFNFLAYSTTGTVARHLGAEKPRAAAEHGIDGIWLAAGLGIGLTMLGLAAVPVIIDVMGASSAVRPFASDYLRISLLGAPFVLVALASAGYLRGVQDTKTTLFVAIGANVANLALELFFVYGLDAGIAGSAWGTVIAQVVSMFVFVTIVRRRTKVTGARLTPRTKGMRSAAFVGSQLMVRTGSLLAALLVTTALAARISNVALAAHQIAFQVWMFLALALDAIAIAGQALVGRYLGAGDATSARSVSRRMLHLGLASGTVLGLAVIATRPWLSDLFTDAADVRRQTDQILWFVAGLQPLAAAVFIFDGILIGAGDAKYLAGAMAAASAIYGGVLLLMTTLDLNLELLWSAFTVWMIVRWLGLVRRFRTERWAVTGAERS